MKKKKQKNERKREKKQQEIGIIVLHINNNNNNLNIRKGEHLCNTCLYYSDFYLLKTKQNPQIDSLYTTYISI